MHTQPWTRPRLHPALDVANFTAHLHLRYTIHERTALDRGP